MRLSYVIRAGTRYGKAIHRRSYRRGHIRRSLPGHCECRCPTLEISCPSYHRSVFCGVDEAGKGAVLGPMVVAAVGCTDPGDLLPLGLRDSKQLTPSRRELLYDEIVPRFPSTVLVIGPGEIDEHRRRMTLNMLLADAHAQVIARLRPAVAYVDACDVVAPRHGRQVSGRLGFRCRVVARHHADEVYPVVMAASIVAKVTRDRAVAGLADRYGPLGSGYPSDEETVAFLIREMQATGRPPLCARWSWETVRSARERLEQSRISDFFPGN
jgi:ribonuclease HII